MTQWFPVIYFMGMMTAWVIEYELTAYQIDKKESDEQLVYFQNERAKRLKQQLAVYENNENVIRKYKHDIRHYNRVLAGFIQEKEYDKAAAYLKEFDSMLEQVTVVSFCDNQIVNELLTIYASRCQKMGFKLRVKAIVPARFPMEETDLTSLVANALENAVEAQEKIPAENRQIKFEITYNGKKLKLMSQNPAPQGTSFDENGLPISTRAIKSGIGTKQIKSIAEKYSGAASFTQENGNFILKAVMTCL
jgi:sensor histidine kinase regulating citrate/malate metabolism